MHIEDICPLVVLSSPSGEQRLRLDQEARKLRQLSNSLSLPDDTFTILDAATEGDLLDALAARNHTVLHFSGHGGPDGIFVEDSGGDNGLLIDVERLERILTVAKPHLCMAIFLSCNSLEMAQRLIQHVPLLICIDGKGNDELCMRFVCTLYKHMFAGKSFQRAYELSTNYFIPHFQTVIMRRHSMDSSKSSLILASNFEYVLFVDIEPAKGDLLRLNIDEKYFINQLSRRTKGHRWAFRFAREGAMFPFGEFVVTFKWENADDYIECIRVQRFKDDLSPSILSLFANRLIRFNYLYTSQYRSPFRAIRVNEKSIITQGLIELRSYYHDLFENLDKKFDELLLVDQKQVNITRAFSSSNLEMAETMLKNNDFGRTIQHLEAALTSIHDLMTIWSSHILE